MWRGFLSLVLAWTEPVARSCPGDCPYHGVDFCGSAALDEALARYGKPEIFNMAQGRQSLPTKPSPTRSVAPVSMSLWTEKGACWII